MIHLAHLGLVCLLNLTWVFYQILNLSIVKLSISRNTQLLLSKASTRTSSISLNTQLDNTQVEYLVKYSTWVDQADKS